MPVAKKPYTPDFETIKAYYVQGALQGSDPVWLPDITPEQAEADFMRWFHDHNQKVLEQERRKIWSVLEDAFKKVTGNG